MIPAADPAGEYAALKAEIDEAVFRVLSSGRYIGGPEVEALEEEFARACGVPHAVAVGSGTDALRLALLAAEAGEAASAIPRGTPKDGAGPPEVITSPFSFFASVEAIGQVGAATVFADIDPDTLTLDPRRVERALTKRTRAIIPVHLYGHPADLDPIRDLAARRGLVIVEDACQAHGALYKGKPAGSLATAGAFSFYPTKNLGGCGEGGMVTTGDRDLAGRVRRLRDHGQEGKYRHVESGYNARLDALQAAILRVKLKRLSAWNERRRSIAQRYRERLGGSGVVLPVERPWARHVFHQFTVRVRRRDEVRAALEARGVAAQVHYPIPLHLQPALAGPAAGAGSFPEAERAAREVLSLPVHPGLSDGQVDLVCDALLAAVGAG